MTRRRCRYRRGSDVARRGRTEPPPYLDPAVESGVQETVDDELGRPTALERRLRDGRRVGGAQHGVLTNSYHQMSSVTKTGPRKIVSEKLGFKRNFMLQFYVPSCSRESWLLMATSRVPGFPRKSETNPVPAMK